jgi:arylsulfatase A-like enzyme
LVCDFNMLSKIDLKSLLIFCCCLLAFRADLFSQQVKPNIIIFLVDDMGWQDTSVPFWNNPTSINKKFHTPNMERLAANGMKFSNAYAHPVCTPTRVSLMTGMNVARHHITNWTSVSLNTPTDFPDSLLIPAQWNYHGLSPIKDIEKTVYATALPELLKAGGYYTIHCGKAHFAPYGLAASNPVNIGFDVNIGGTAAGHPGSFLGEKNYRSHENDTSWAVKGLDHYAANKLFLTEALTQEAILALKKHKDKPFFLYMAHYAVHLPFDKDDRFYQRYIEEGLTETEAKYAALVEGMDKSLGDILNYLKENNLDKNTYLFFMSDNGGLSLTPQRGGETHSQNLPLKQGKGSLYEGGIRVPMIATGPGIENKSVSNQTVITEDLFPTVLEIAGIKNYKTVQTVDGESILSNLLNKKKMDPSKVLVWHYPNNWINQNFHGTSWVSAIRKGPWKLIYFHKTGQLELYQLDDDISETNDLSKKMPDKTKQMAELLTHELKKRNAPMPYFKNTNKQIPWPDELL